MRRAGRRANLWLALSVAMLALGFYLAVILIRV